MRRNVRTDRPCLWSSEFSPVRHSDPVQRILAAGNYPTAPSSRSRPNAALGPPAVASSAEFRSLRRRRGGQHSEGIARLTGFLLVDTKLFLQREGYGSTWHLSLHASEQWHMKESGKPRIRWNRPAEIVPGYTRAVGIVQPVVVAHREDPVPDGVELVQVTADANPIVFSLFLERADADVSGWPGKNADGSTFVGRIPLAGAETCVVVAVQEPLPPGRVVGPRPSAD
jgi:hypothetical protein